jgi:ferredoxin
VPEIYFKTSGRVVRFRDGDEVNVLRVSIREDCGLPWRCASGKCGTDRFHVESGAENLSPVRPRERDRLGELLQQGYRLGCQTYASGDVVITWDPDQRGLDEASQVGQRLRAKWLAEPDNA